MLAIRCGRAREAAAYSHQRTGARTKPYTLGAFCGGGPVVYHRSESNQTLHAASLEAVRACLPSADLHPVRLPGDRAIVMVGSFRHEVLTATGVEGQAVLPYGELMVAVFVSRRAAPPILPLLAPAITGLAAGAFVLHMPVTNRVARDGGRLAWGYAKFVADMEFEDSIETCRVSLSEGGRSILTHTVWPSGRPAVLGESLTLYSVLDGQLMALDVPMSGLAQRRRGRRGGHLMLGDHQVTDELRGLDISPEPFLTRRISGLHLALDPGRPMGPARQYLGYIGEDRDLGRYIVRYPGAAPIDQYAPYASTAGPSETLEAAQPPTERAEVPR